jgi:hypothetical protein
MKKWSSFVSLALICATGFTSVGHSACQLIMITVKDSSSYAGQTVKIKFYSGDRENACIDEVPYTVGTAKVKAKAYLPTSAPGTAPVGYLSSVSVKAVDGTPLPSRILSSSYTPTRPAAISLETGYIK